MDKIRIHANPDSDPYGDFTSMLVVDDDWQMLDLIGEFVSTAHKNIIVGCCSSPETVIPMMKQCFCDIGVFDMNMPNMTGDKLAEKAWT